jgi:hypothetical protein
MLLGNISVSANQISGRELLAACDDSKGPEAKQYCVGYITAAIETHATWALWRQLQRVFCFPEGDKFEHAFGGVVEYLRGHPEHLDLEASSLVLTAINERFACE